MQKSSFLTKFDSEVNPHEDNWFSNRVLARRLDCSKFCRAYDKAAAAKQALAIGQHPPRRDPHPEHFKNDDWEQHPEDDDFDEEEVEEEDCWIDEEFDHRDFCPMTSLYYEDYMRRRNEWFERYFQDLYARRELEQAEKDYFTESCWDAILSECK